MRGWRARFGLEPRIFGEDDTADIDHAALVHGDGMVLVESERPEELHGSHAGHGWLYLAVGNTVRCPPSSLKADMIAFRPPPGARPAIMVRQLPGARIRCWQ